MDSERPYSPASPPEASEPPAAGSFATQDPVPVGPEAPPHPWAYRDLFYLLLFVAGAAFLIIVVCSLVFAGLNLALGWGLDLESPKVQAPFVLIVTSLVWISAFAFIYTLITVKYGLPFAEAIGWTDYEGAPTTYLAGGVILAVSVALISTLLPKPEGKLKIEALLEDPTALVLLALFAVFLAPVLEEMLFRGFIYRVVEQSNGAGMAVSATSLVFSLVHGDQYGWLWQNLLLLFGVGLVFGIVRARTGSILPGVFIHAAYNGTLSAAMIAAGQQVEKL
jgi:membrane protease YdiL (CAAX protease family)